MIIFSPFYENNGADTILAGARPIYMPLHPPTFGFDRDELRRAFAQKPRAIVVCNPSNPCGKVFTERELTFIGELAREHAFISPKAKKPSTPSANVCCGWARKSEAARPLDSARESPDNTAVKSSPGAVSSGSFFEKRPPVFSGTPLL